MCSAAGPAARSSTWKAPPSVPTSKPQRRTAAMIPSRSASAGSVWITARSEAKFTAARPMPSAAFRTRSRRAEQAPHVMPSMAKSNRCRSAVGLALKIGPPCRVTLVGISITSDVERRQCRNKGLVRGMRPSGTNGIVRTGRIPGPPPIGHRSGRPVPALPEGRPHATGRSPGPAGDRTRRNPMPSRSPTDRYPDMPGSQGRPRTDAARPPSTRSSVPVM